MVIIDEHTIRQILLPMLGVPIVAIFASRFGVWPSLFATAVYLVGIFLGAAALTPWDPPTVSATADSITALSAFAAVVVGAFGLRSWQHELRGRTEYALATRILTLVYHVREGVRVVRNSAMSSNEYAGRPRRSEPDIDSYLDAPGAPPQHESDADDTIYAYQKRWEKIAAPSTELATALLEAEAHWDDLLLNARGSLDGVIRDLWLAIMQHVRSIRDPRYANSISVNKRNQIDRTIYADHPAIDEADETDMIADRLAAAVERFESVLRPKLHRG